MFAMPDESVVRNDTRPSAYSERLNALRNVAICARLQLSILLSQQCY